MTSGGQSGDVWGTLMSLEGVSWGRTRVLGLKYGCWQVGDCFRCLWWEAGVLRRPWDHHTQDPPSISIGSMHRKMCVEETLPSKQKHSVFYFLYKIMLKIIFHAAFQIRVLFTSQLYSQVLLDTLTSLQHCILLFPLSAKNITLF